MSAEPHAAECPNHPCSSERTGHLAGEREETGSDAQLDYALVKQMCKDLQKEKNFCIVRILVADKAMEKLFKNLKTNR